MFGPFDDDEPWDDLAADEPGCLGCILAPVGMVVMTLGIIWLLTHLMDAVLK